jgi:hypothetical protein
MDNRDIDGVLSLRARCIERNAPGAANSSFASYLSLGVFHELKPGEDFALVFCMCFPDVIPRECGKGASELDPIC